jgi:hypothetical protein
MGTLAARASLLAVVVLASVAAGPRDALSRARDLYNRAQYDAAVDAASEASLTPDLSDGASLVLARAYLERYRQAADAGDLALAREALKQVRPARLGSDDQVELTIALGESLYFDDRAGAAAEQFELALAHTSRKRAERYERLLDWWASALDRQAQLGSDADARTIEARIVARMEGELRRDAGATVASYWLAAGARGAGDVERAWDVAIAAWVRADQAGRRGVALRAELDRLVLQAIIPERARQLAPKEFPTAAAAMRQQWAALKAAWAVP